MYCKASYNLAHKLYVKTENHRSKTLMCGLRNNVAETDSYEATVYRSSRGKAALALIVAFQNVALLCPAHFCALWICPPLCSLPHGIPFLEFSRCAWSRVWLSGCKCRSCIKTKWLELCQCWGCSLSLWYDRISFYHAAWCESVKDVLFLFLILFKPGRQTPAVTQDSRKHWQFCSFISKLQDRVMTVSPCAVCIHGLGKPRCDNLLGMTISVRWRIYVEDSLSIEAKLLSPNI